MSSLKSFGLGQKNKSSDLFFLDDLPILPQIIPLLRQDAGNYYHH
jgi:hypothetical protein